MQTIWYYAITSVVIVSLLYIAGSDLIPELHKEVEAKKSLLQFAFLVAGFLVMMALLLLE